MRVTIVWLISMACMAATAHAEERPTALPEIVIGGERNAHAVSDRCVEVEIGSSRAMECLNQKLKREVDRVNPSLALPPLDARSPDTKVGVVNIPGVQQQYGRNFGVSIVPYRPAPLTYSSPLGPRR
jgi:hypothetical protein